MIRKTITLIILSALLFISCGQSNSSNEKEFSELEQRIEAYIVERIIPQHHQSIEFHEKKKFNLNQLIADHKTPEIYHDVPKAFQENEEAFKLLEQLSNELNIAYSMTYVFEYKNEETDPWYSSWILMLLDEEDNIVGHIRYNP